MSAKSKVLIPVVLFEGTRTIPHYISRGVPGDQLRARRGWSEAGAPYPHDPDQRTDPTEWLPAPEWSGKLRVLGYRGGRSSSCYLVRIEIPGELPVEGLMSCSAFFSCIEWVHNGVVPGRWAARKQGKNYMIVGV